MRRRVVISPRATKEIDQAARWWAARGAPLLIDDAIARVLARLVAMPESAARVQIRGEWSNTRCASMERGYQLFYRYDAVAGTILVRCFWHERRSRPRL